MRRNTSPLTTLPDEHTRYSFDYVERLPMELSSRYASRDDDRCVAVGANLHVVGFHDVVS
jgi:hypothetical protein